MGLRKNTTLQGWGGAPTTANVQSEYDNLQNSLQHGVNGQFDTQGYYDARNHLNDLRMKLMTGAGQKGAGTGAAAADPVADAKTKILDYTAGRGDAVMNDAMTNAALGRLQGVATGNDAPFTQSVQNQMLSKQAGMNASAQGAQGEQLRMQAAAAGGSIADPSYQAKMRELAANTQAANTSAQGDISTNAQLQNFGARQTANNSLIGSRAGQLGMANSQYNQAAGYLNQTQQSGQHINGTAQPPIYNFYGAGNGAGSNYQTPAVQPGNVYKPPTAPVAPNTANATAIPAQSGGSYAHEMDTTGGGGYNFDDTVGTSGSANPMTPTPYSGWGGAAAGAAPPPVGPSLVIPPSLGGPMPPGYLAPAGYGGYNFNGYG